MDVLDDVHALHASVDSVAHGDVQDHHAFLNTSSAEEADTGIASVEDSTTGVVNLPEDDDVENSLRPLSLRSKRKKIGKALQLVLLRKYVACAKQLDRIPDRATTEHLLEEGYEEYFFQGGTLHEPRLGYPAFLKLIRNRRSEAFRQVRSCHGLSPHSKLQARRIPKEQVEIRTLIEELERIRNQNTPQQQQHSMHIQSTLQYDQLANVLQGETSNLAAAASTSSNTSTTAQLLLDASTSADTVILSREKLDMMMRFAQETLKTQKRILKEVRAIESRLQMR
jgi:hypothetical protein